MYPIKTPGGIGVAHHFLLAGKPPPRVVWYRNGRIFSTAAKSTVTITHGLLTVNNITLESLSRDDVHTKLTCQTTNFEATTLRSSVELDMKCMLQYLAPLQAWARVYMIFKKRPFLTK